MVFLIDLTASTSSLSSVLDSSNDSPLNLARPANSPSNVPRSANADFEAFKRTWRQKVDLSSDPTFITSTTSSSETTPKRTKTALPSSPLTLSASVRRSPRLLSKQSSHSFSATLNSPLQIMPCLSENEWSSSQLSRSRRLSTSSTTTASPLKQPLSRIKNRLETIAAIRVHMSKSLHDQFFSEIERRFTARNMSECLDSSRLVKKQIPGLARGCFRWSLPAAKAGFLAPRLFVVDAEALWDEFVAKQRFFELLQPFLGVDECLLYLFNWKRAANKHTAQLNRLFRQAVLGAPSQQIMSPFTAADLENEFFLQAADLGVKVNFSTATSEAQSTADLIDFVLEMTRIVAKTSWDRASRANNPRTPNIQLTLPADFKVKSGKDARDCWHRILCQIPRVTPPVADALSQHFPSFKALMRAVSACGCDEDGQRLFEELRLHEGEGKRVGPSIALRLYRHFKW
jgi:hypothetical protein